MFEDGESAVDGTIVHADQLGDERLPEHGLDDGAEGLLLVVNGHDD